MKAARAMVALIVLALLGLVRQPVVVGAGTAPTWRHEVVRSFPHDPDAYTQGLLVRDGFLYESTGQKGRSSLRKVEIETGKVVQRLAVGNQYFAEGLAAWGTQLIQLTWETNLGFVYDRATFKQLRTFTYKGEGWGLADDGKRLVMSDGSPNLRFLDPDTLAEINRVRVLDGPAAVDNLNELEVVQGDIFANVWLTDRIAVIAPATGRVTAWLDLKGLMPAQANPEAVLNGIAYDAARDRLFVTGKLWPRMFEIRVIRR
ncbi:MAG TPA: glutaminyl-peptide cyclotransferase [Vicinamibacterales bacterium]|nr:glutaminyl-peptide cyclotransferase [Vicinamibacterales bacterium]